MSGSSTSIHVVENELAHRNQWAYKQGHSTEMLLIKMTEDWRKARDNNLVVGIVSVDFRKAFDSISHDVLMLKLQGLGISGDFWSWILDYLSNRFEVTVVNGTKSDALPIKFGVPQGSRLGPTLFSLICNDPPDVAENDGIIHMFAHDITRYAIGPSADCVTISLNNMFTRLYDWFCCNCLTPHPGKSEVMFLSRRAFISPLQSIKLGDCHIKYVFSTRCLGIKIDNQLKWVVHLT